MATQRPAPQPLTAANVHEVLGPMDDELVARIIATGATVEELIEAFEWFNADDYMGREVKHPFVGVVAEVCEILQEELPEPEGR